MIYEDISYHVKRALNNSNNIYRFVIRGIKMEINKERVIKDDENLTPVEYPEYKTLEELLYIKSVREEEEKRVQLCKELGYCPTCGVVLLTNKVSKSRFEQYTDFVCPKHGIIYAVDID